MRRRAFWSMVTVAVVTLLVGGVTAAFLIGRSVEASIRSEFHRQAAATGLLIESSLDGDRRTVRDVAGLSELLTIARRIGGHDYVEAAAVGAGGAVTFLSDEVRLLTAIPGGAAALHRPMQFDQEVNGQRVTAFAQPVDVGERGRVIVVLGTDLDVIDWDEILRRYLLAILIAVGLAAALAVWLSRGLTRRLDPLRQAAASVAAGDLTVRAGQAPDPEITQVALAFNEMAEELEAARRREREFIANVGHDLRTPLTTIRGYSEALGEGRVDASEVPGVARVLGAQSDRLHRLVDDLMLLSRLEAKEFTLRPERLDLSAHVSGIVAEFRPRAETAGVTLTFEPDLAVQAIVDPDRVGQVVANLLENALRYTPEAGTVKVAVTATPGGPAITVADTGPGIDAEDLPHIFERLYVTQRYRPLRPEGSGLGLSIVRQLVDAMGGIITVTSTPGRGTEFTIALSDAG